MKIKVDLIHGGWLKAPNGASSVLRSFYDNRELFNENDISLSFYTMDAINNKFEMTNKTDYQKNSVINKVKTIINYLSKYFSVISLFNIYMTYCRHAIIIAKKYTTIDQKGDIVFIHDIFTAYYYFKYRITNQKSCLVLHTNGDTFNMLKIYYPCLKNSIAYKVLLKMENQVLINSNKILFVSKASMDLFNKNYSCHKEKTGYVHNGIVLNSQIDDNVKFEYNYKYRLCCVGTISPRKGQFRLVKALSLLPKDLLNEIHVTLIGSGIDYDDIVKFIKDKQIERHVAMPGSRNDVDRFLSQSNIFILPSNDEGLPISILEAMRMSLPIISTNIAGIPEQVIPLYNGLLINPDEQSIYNALLQLPQLDINELGKNSRLLFEKEYTINRMITNYSNIFKKL